MAALNLFFKRQSHVVSQVVETELIIGSVRHVTCVVLTLDRLIVLSWENHANGETQEIMDPPHGFCISLSEVLVHGDDVNPVARKAV